MKWNMHINKIFQCANGYGHRGKHHTAHGSMKPMAWVGIAPTFKYENRTFTGGDLGGYVYCHMVRVLADGLC